MIISNYLRKKKTNLDIC